MKIPKFVFTTAKILDKNRYEAWLVGGSVRDLIIQKPAFDYDIATNAPPATVMSIFKRVIPTGIKHGTVTVLVKDDKVEITTFRKDGKYSDGRRPDEVTYAESIYEDISRRDFTINGIAYNLITEELIDPYNGQGDIEKKIIRTIGNPIERFNEDGLRLFRACRFASQLNFSIEENTFKAIGECLDVASRVSSERIRDEFLKIIQSDKPSVGIELLRTSGLLKLFLPELLKGYGINQNKYHRYDIYYHNLHSADSVPKDRHLIRISALFHDIGKYYAKKDVLESGGTTKSVFYNHELIGAAITKKIMRRLKFSNNEIRAVTHLIRNHMFHYTTQWTDGAVRRFLRKIGVENLDDLFELRKADRIGNGLKRGESIAVKNLKRRIDKIIEEENAITVNDLAVNGYDLMSRFNLKSGPIIGKILNNLLEAILDDPSKNEKEILLSLAFDMLERDVFVKK